MVLRAFVENQEYLDDGQLGVLAHYGAEILCSIALFVGMW